MGIKWSRTCWKGQSPEEPSPAPRVIPRSLKNWPSSRLPAQKMLTGTAGSGTCSWPGFRGAGSLNGEGPATTTEDGSGMRLQRPSHLPTLPANHGWAGQASTWPPCFAQVPPAGSQPKLTAGVGSAKCSFRSLPSSQEEDEVRSNTPPPRLR